MTRKQIPLIDRLMTRVEAGPGECWIFVGAIDTTTGYGKIGRGRRSEGVALVHRVAYEYFVGDIPGGLDLDHLCRNRSCCNPWHLEPVTRLVNVNRGLRRRGYRLEQCRRGHPLTPDTTYTTYRPDGSFRYQRCKQCIRFLNQQKRQTA